MQCCKGMHAACALRKKLSTLAFLKSESRLHIASRDHDFWRPSRATLISFWIMFTKFDGIASGLTYIFTHSELILSTLGLEWFDSNIHNSCHNLGFQIALSREMSEIHTHASQTYFWTPSLFKKTEWKSCFVFWGFFFFTFFFCHRSVFLMVLYSTVEPRYKEVGYYKPLITR